MSILDNVGITAQIVKVKRPRQITGSNLITNGTFATDLTGWTSFTDSGNATIARDATYAALKITTNAVGDGCVYQTITTASGLESGGYYLLSFESVMQGFYITQQGHFAVYDNSNTEYIIPKRAAWGIYEGPQGGSTIDGTVTTAYFWVPEDCTSIAIYLYQNTDSDNGATTYVMYDNVTLYRREVSSDMHPAPSLSIDSMDSYQHSITADGGFDEATITTKMGAGQMADWLTDGLAHGIVVKDAGGNTIWEGFINEVRAQFGATTLTVGPLTDVANRARILFKTMDWNTSPPVKGDAAKSVFFEQTESIEKFGILEGVFSGGEGDVDEALQVIQAVVEETAWPDTAHNFSLGGGSISVQIQCRGWQHMMDKYFYYRTGLAGKEETYYKLQWILRSDPNGLFDLLSAEIELNTSQLPIWEDEDKTAKAAVKEAVAGSDGSLSRYIWGIYEGRKFVYKSQPTDVYYERSAGDGRIFINGTEINPWLVRPGRWVKTTEMIGGHITESDIVTLRRDPTTMFIESVTYTAPYSLSITGSKAGKFKQRLASLGLVD